MADRRDRPNILFIMADQLPARTLGAYGHPIVRTPNLDRLAERGTRFDAAYTNCPICAPSRASMCAGRYVSAIGSYDNGADLPASVPTFAHDLRRAGYETLLSGKMHFIGPDQHHGFERRLTTDIYPSSFVWTPDWTLGPVPNPGTAVDQLRTAGLCTWNLQLDYDEETHFRALDALRRLARRRADPGGRNFFLCVSYTHPHDPFITTREWWDRYDHDTIDMPHAPARPLDEMHPYDRWLQVHHMVDRYPPSDEHIRNARHAFYGMVSYFDAKVGELVAELERLGLAESTVVIVTSDHGEMLGEHGMWFKRTYFDPSARVPLIATGPGISAGHVASETVSLVDLYPTFLEIADAPDRDRIAADLDGESLVPLFEGRTGGVRGYALGEYFSEGAIRPMRMAVQDRLKYVYVHGEREQAFDLSNDPDEVTDVVSNPAYRDRLDALRRIVHDGWDAEETYRRVLESQRRRRRINEATAHGRPVGWDVTPDHDSAHLYVRSENGQATNAKERYPRVD